MPDGWRKYDSAEVLAEIENILTSKGIFDEISSLNDELTKSSDELKRTLCVQLSLIEYDTGLEAERDYYKQLKAFSFGKTQNEYLSSRMSGTMMTRDRNAIIQGKCIPSHLFYEGNAAEGIYKSNGIIDFINLTEILMGRLRIREEFFEKRNNEGAMINLKSLHNEIYNKCHKLFEDGSFSEAAEKSFKAVKDRLREITGFEKGSDAFGRGRLFIEGASASNVENDFNEGAKFLCMAIDMFRNSKSHTSNANITDPVLAFEYLSLSSLAMHLLDDYRINERNDK